MWVTKMKILSIDQSTTSSGYCICDIAKNFEIVEYDVIKVTGDFEERLIKMCKGIELLLKNRIIELIILEGVFKLCNTKVFGELSQLLGALKELANIYSIPVKVISSSEWRKLFNVPPKAKRKELKQLSKNYVLENFGLSVIDDVSDAICLGYYWYLKEKERFDGTF